MTVIRRFDFPLRVLYESVGSGSEPQVAKIPLGGMGVPIGAHAIN